MTKTSPHRATKSTSRPSRKTRATAAPAPKPKKPRKQAATVVSAKDRRSPDRKASKTQVCLDHLRRPDGASIEELQAATGWQAHSVRGFMSGMVKKKLGLTLASEKPKDGTRRYRIVQAGS
jgi:hypothetical protein